MNYSTILSSTDDEIRSRVLLLARGGSEATGRSPWLSEDDLISRLVRYSVASYVGLARTVDFAVTPDMLLHLGWPGRELHRLFCSRAGDWGAFRTLVSLLSDLPCRTPLNEGAVLLHSRPERFVYRELSAISGVTRIDVHPPLPGRCGCRRADFLLTAVTCLSVYVEVTMISAQADVADTSVLARYRAEFLQKMALYAMLGIEPVVIWSDEAASPRALAAKLNVIRARLGLPTRPPAPPAWYECEEVV